MQLFYTINVEQILEVSVNLFTMLQYSKTDTNMLPLV